MRFTLSQRDGDGGKGFNWEYSGNPGLGSIRTLELTGHIGDADDIYDAVIKALDQIGHIDPRMKDTKRPKAGPEND